MVASLLSALTDTRGLFLQSTRKTVANGGGKKMYSLLRERQVIRHGLLKRVKTKKPDGERRGKTMETIQFQEVKSKGVTD